MHIKKTASKLQKRGAASRPLSRQVAIGISWKQESIETFS